MIRKMMNARKNEESGFTLVELLVVILIIGILAAIAIPVFLNQRQRANDSAVESDVRNLATAIESALISEPNVAFGDFTDNTGDDTITVGDDGETVTLSDGVEVTYFGSSEDTVVANGYRIEAHHENGRQYTSSTPLVYESNNGGMQGAGTPTTGTGGGEG